MNKIQWTRVNNTDPTYTIILHKPGQQVAGEALVGRAQRTVIEHMNIEAFLKIDSTETIDCFMFAGILLTIGIFE